MRRSCRKTESIRATVTDYFESRHKLDIELLKIDNESLEALCSARNTRMQKLNGDGKREEIRWEIED